MKKYAALLVSLLALSACCGPKTQDYAKNSPTLDIRQYLNGDLEAWGLFASRTGTVDPFFHVKMKGTWSGDNGTLAEHFNYSDGRTQDRKWTLHVADLHHFTATAPDVIGTATGEQYGNSAHMHYMLVITDRKGDTHTVTVDDWIYLMADGKTVINRSQMSKFGFHVGDLVLTFHKK